MRVAVAATLLLLSGCVQTDASDASLHLDQDGGPADLRATTSCPDTAVLDLSVTVRDGGVRVRVLDGSGAVVFDETYAAPDGGEAERGLFGAPGTWTLTADAADFDGRLDALLSCD